MLSTEDDCPVSKINLRTTEEYEVYIKFLKSQINREEMLRSREDKLRIKEEYLELQKLRFKLETQAPRKKQLPGNELWTDENTKKPKKKKPRIMKVQEDGVQVYGDKSMKSKEELGVNIEDKGPMDEDQEIILNPDFPKPMKMMWD